MKWWQVSRGLSMGLDISAGRFGSSHGSSSQAVQQSRRLMEQAGIPEQVIKNFERLLARVVDGERGIIEESAIKAVGPLETLEQISSEMRYKHIGQLALNHLAVIRLNGGLGTTMGLAAAKSILPVRDGKTFNDVMIDQLRHLRDSSKVTIPLIHMTSFSTHGDLERVMAGARDLQVDGIRTLFQQHKHPKVDAHTKLPMREANEELNWNPPGHGDIYGALLATGLAEELLARGKRYLFVANSDNLGATVEPAILGFMVAKNCPFLMETCVRSSADSKGGHLAIDAATGRYVLREVANAPTLLSGEPIPAFTDTQKYNQFNTNNIWLDLRAVVDQARREGGCIELPLISNRKTVNPRDPKSTPVIQIESAMGAAIRVFDGSRALQVPRGRFIPVKSNSDLFLIRSDVYRLTPDHRLELSSERTQPTVPTVRLDKAFYGVIDDFERRCSVIPSLCEADSLEVKGDVIFDRPIRIVGDVVIEGRSDRPLRIPEHINVLENTKLELK